MERISSSLRIRPKILPWPTALITLLVVRAVVPYTIKPGSQLLSYGAVSYFILLLLASGFAIRNGIQKRLGERPFWMLLALGYGLWALNQCIFLYYEFGRHIDVPDNSIADPVLFLHIVLLIAAAAIVPIQNERIPKLYRAVSNALLPLLFWGFLYVYSVFPYQYLFSNGTSYALRYDTLYLLENLTLVSTAWFFSFRVRSPWKPIYLHLLGASSLYALSSAVANIAIDSGGYVPGKLYGLGLTASACWFLWIPLRVGRSTGAEINAARFDTNQGSQASTWAMLLVLMISIPMVWELFQMDETASIRKFRFLIAVAAFVCLAGIAYIAEYCARSELISKLDLANDRLRLAVESGKSVGWDWDLKTGRNSWFGDLQTMFGIPSDGFVGRIEDFYRCVHPQDRGLVAEAVTAARQNRKSYAAEFRVVRLDDTVCWVAATGQFHYAANGDPERMLGIAVDVTERRDAEESLRLFRKLIDESNDAIEVVDPKTLCFLDVNDKCCRDLGYTRDELLSLSVFDIDPAYDGAFQARIRKELDRAGFVIFESVHRRKDGSIYPVEINLKHVGLDRLYSVNVVRDITQRKWDEEVLRQKEEELTKAQRLAKLGSWQWDARTDSVVWSEELYRLMGYDPHLPAPTYKEHPKLFTVESWERLQLAVNEALQTGTPYELDMEVAALKSTAKWAIARGEALCGAGGEIIGLRGTVQDITERKRAEKALYESEDRLRLLLDSTAEAIYGIDLEYRCTFCNPACVRALGYEHIDEIVGKNMHHLIHQIRGDETVFPVAECRICQTTRTGEGVHVYDEVLWRANGTSFPAEYWCHPQRKGQEVVGAVVAFVDITQRKLADAALASVSGKLIEAQEQERRRIARELHDDIGQRLALLAIALAQLKHDVPDSPEFSRHISELQKRTSEIAVDIQSLSHELHSSRLQYLGIAAALRGFCQEFGEQQKVKIDFDANDLPIPLSPDISLCFLRVLQEALHNSAKHSGVQDIEVRLWGTQNEVHLTVSDSGAGFDHEAATARPGLGLTSMAERVKLLNGTLTIESQPQHGTKIHALVPLSLDIKSTQPDRQLSSQSLSNLSST